MKHFLWVFAVILLAACNTPEAPKQSTEQPNYNRSDIGDAVDATNDFYDNADTYELSMTPVTVDGEIAEAFDVNFDELPLHSVIVKETILSKDGDTFVGAFRYDGYALYDIINLAKLNKANKEAFAPIIDLYVEITNEKGEKVNVSWGEIYYPNNLQEIIIAKRVMRIIPSKTNELWTLPTSCKMVFNSDLITERNISNPTKITIKSYPESFETVKGLKPLYSPQIAIHNEEGKEVEVLKKNPSSLTEYTFHTIFYGRGRGIHSTQPFTGVLLKDILAKHTERDQKALREGYFVIVAKDGYRGVYTYSELMNRNDQSEVLLVCDEKVKDDGIFTIHPACDFFSDRAIKGITDIYYIK